MNRLAGPQVAPDRRPRAVAVVGAGASGTLTATQILRTRSGSGIRVVLVDPSPLVGRGVAYGTDDDRHRLNVPAARMSAFPDAPDHFVGWVRANVDPGGEGCDFLPRSSYGRYLGDVLAEAVRAAGDHELERVQARAVGLVARPHVLDLMLDDGQVLHVDSVVLAQGNHPPSGSWVPASLTSSSRFVADPWAVGALDGLPPGDVLLVGTGLTMVDVALSLSGGGRRLHAISRSGLLPRRHRRRPLPPGAPPDVPKAVQDLASVEDLVRSVAVGSLVEHGDWRPGLDSVRAVADVLWDRLDDDDRSDFLRRHRRLWDSFRHRMAPQVADQISAMRRSGGLSVGRGEVLDAEETAAGVTVELADGSRLEVGAVVDCTGGATDVTRVDDLLLRDLLAQGLARPDQHHLGLDVDDRGRLVSVDGDASPRLRVVGAARRGRLWETTGIGELRGQALQVASDVAEMFAVPRTRRPRDRYGLPLSTTFDAAQAYEDAVLRLLLVQTGAEVGMREAVALDPGFALGHLGLALLGHEFGMDVDVEASLGAAEEAAALRATGRERSLVHAMAQRIRGGGDPAAGAALLAHARANPRDALAVSLCVPTIAFSGVTEVPEVAWALVESLAPTYGDDWWYSGLLAFTRQEQHRWDEAERLASRSLDEVPASGHAAHARTHVRYETGEHIAGLSWLDAWVDGCGLTASQRAHFAWHAALHELAIGDDDAVRSRYLRQLAPPEVVGCRALVDSGSLLWRMRLHDMWQDEVPIEAVLTAGGDLVEQPTTPFVALHSAIALATADDVDGLRRLLAHVRRRPAPDTWRDVVVPLVQAYVDLATGRPGRAADGLAVLSLRLQRLGGSDAQREVVEDTWLSALLAAGRANEARVLLDRRLDRRRHPRDEGRLAILRRRAVDEALPPVPAIGPVSI